MLCVLWTRTNVVHFERVFSLFAPTYVHADLIPLNISLIVLAAREVANVLEEKKGSSDNYIDTLNPKPTSMPKNIGNIVILWSTNK